MRARIFLLKASCVLLSAFLICGKGPVAYCQEIVAAIATTHPEFISGMLMDLHYKNSVIANLVAHQNTAEKNPVSAAEEKKNPEELINYIIKKNSPAENKETITVTPGKTDVPGNKDSASVAAVVADPVQVKETKLPETNEADKTAIDETPAVAPEEEIDPLITKYAEMISVEPADISNYPLYRFIDKWYGTRYKWGGMDNTGIDCSAFSQRLYSDVYGVGITRTARQQHRSSEIIKNHEEANEGDLVFFRVHRILVSHVGVYLANGYFVHASRSHGVVISSLNNKYWSRRYAGCGRIEREDKPGAESDFTP